MDLGADFVIRSAEIIAVGTELLLGQIQNTNATFLAQELQKLGISTYYQTVVGDNRSRLRETLERAISRCDLVLLTGGLGPTPDDITLEVSAEATGQTLVLQDDLVETLKAYFASRKRRMTESNLKQAMLPALAESLPNSNGTAPGALIPSLIDGKLNCLLALLPGPPNENRPMFLDQLVPLLKQHSPQILENTYVHLIDIGESDAAAVMADYLADSQDNPTLAPYASTGEMAFRITHRRQAGDSSEAVEDLIEVLQSRLGQYIYEIGDRSLAEVVVDLLQENDLTVAFAESLTAGMVASELASVSGLGKVLAGSICVYQTEIKASVLGVSEDVLDNEGAISHACAREMAEKGRKMFNVDYCISTTGNAGPDAMEDKEVGEVYIGIASKQGTHSVGFNFSGNRQKIRENTSKQALNQLRKAILDQLSQS